MYVYIYIYIYIYMYAYKSIRYTIVDRPSESRWRDTVAYICPCISIYTYIYAYICMNAHIYVCIDMYICVYIYMYIFIYICICTCMFIYIYDLCVTNLYVWPTSFIFHVPGPRGHRHRARTAQTSRGGGTLDPEPLTLIPEPLTLNPERSCTRPPRASPPRSNSTNTSRQRCCSCRLANAIRRCSAGWDSQKSSL